MKLKYTLRGMGIGLVLASLLFFFLRGSDGQALSDDEIKKRATELGMLTPEVLAEKKLDELKESISDKEKAEEQLNKITKNTGTKEEVVNSPSNHEGEKSSKEEGTSSSTEKTNKEADKATEKNHQETENKTEEGKTNDKPLKTGSEQTTLQGGDSTETETTGEGLPKAEVRGADTLQTNPNDSKKAGQEQLVKPQKVEESETKAEIKTYTYEVIPGSSAVRLCKDLETLGLIKDASDFNHYLAVNNYATRIRKGTFTFYSTETYFEIAEKLVSRQINP